jgi:hypothetical protein
MNVWLTVMLPIGTTILGAVIGYFLSRLSKHSDRKFEKKEKQVDKLQQLIMENIELKRKIEEITGKGKRKEAYRLSKNSTYYVHKATNELFCSVCLDADGNEIHLHVDKESESLFCPKCKQGGVTDNWRATETESAGTSWINW